MPIYQNSTVASDKLILGNVTIEVATTAGATFTNIGAGMLNSFTHAPELYNSQAGNAPDPIEGVADETCQVDFEFLEWDSSVLAVMIGGLAVSTTSSSVATLHAGGYADNIIDPRAWRFTNTRRNAAGATVHTILTVYAGYPDSGPTINFKSDNDTDPVAVMPFTVTGKLDTGRTAGQQLYSITHDES